MILLFVIIFILVLAFGGVLLRGAPYVPTLDRQGKIALELLDLKPGQTLLELGSGDGKMLVLAARAGLNVVGIELNPLLVGVSWLRTRRYRIGITNFHPASIWSVRINEVASPSSTSSNKVSYASGKDWE